MSFDIVCFDCDSTLSKIEGIDELARQVGRAEEMSRLTEAAMNGDLPLEAVYGQRLSVIKPSRASIDWLAGLYVAEVADGAKDLVGSLLAKNKAVHIVSGGIRQAILPLAAYLGLETSHVHAVEIYFNEDGSYRDYDRQSPLARTGGKAEICGQLNKLNNSLVMIGDGTTDMEAKQAGAFVIGFGGVVDRPAVRQLADHYLTGASLMSVLPLVV